MILYFQFKNIIFYTVFDNIFEFSIVANIAFNFFNYF